MNSYELTIVLAGDMAEAKRSEVIEKIKKAVTDSNGTVVKADEWGKKNLAYPIAHKKEAFYYFLEISLPPDRTAGIARMIENDDQVLRHLLVKSNIKNQKSKTVIKEETKVKTEVVTKTKKKPAKKGKK